MSHSIDERYEVYDEQERKARLAHVCAACQEPIAKGHRYCSVFILFEGRASRVKRCLRCQAIHEHLRELGEGETWPAERLDCGEEYEEDWGGPPPEEIAKLAFISADEAQEQL